MPFGPYDGAGTLFKAYQESRDQRGGSAGKAEECLRKTGIDLLGFLS